LLNTIKHLEKHYNTDISKLITAYRDGQSIKDIAMTVELGEMPVRTCCSVLNLRFKQKHRENDLRILESRMANGGNPELLDRLSNDLEVLQREVYGNARTIQNLKDDNAVLRRCVRQQAREEYFDTLLLSELQQQFSELVPTNIPMLPEAATDGTMVLILSDLHYNELIKTETTNGVNVFNNEICKQRILEAIKNLVSAKYNTEKLVVYIVGDIINGTIHLGETSGDVAPMRSVVELAEFLGTVFTSLSKAYNKVTIKMVNGNHSRMSDSQKNYQKAYDFEYILYHMLRAQVPESVYMDYSTTGYLVDNVEGMKIGVFHGDTVRSYSGQPDSGAYKVQNIIENLYGVRVETLISGHTHRPIICQNMFGGLNIVNGCLSGINEYGLSSGFDTIYPSQTIGRIGSDGKFKEVHQVYLGAINGQS